jgi:hypothetical protein
MHKVQGNYFIVVVHVGAVKIYVAAVEALRKNERWGSKPVLGGYNIFLDPPVPVIRLIVIHWFRLLLLLLLLF